MTVVTRPLLDHYLKHDAIPVRHSLTLTEYAHIRTRLYSRLGLHQNSFKGAKILEFGPGTGENAAVLSGYAPASITLVDANPRSLDELHRRVGGDNFAISDVAIIDSNILDFDSDHRYDIVLCEGVIPGQLDPRAFLKHVSSFVRPGGQLVTTTSAELGYLADGCRRLLKPVMHAKFGDDQDLLVRRCADLFARQLAALGSPKLPQDWVIDGFLHDWLDSYFFTIEQSVESIAANFDVLGTSPDFFSDWSWFKRNRSDRDVANQVVLEGYKQRRGYLIDDRVFPTQLPSFGDQEAKLVAAVDAFMELSAQLHRSNCLDGYGEALDLLAQIEATLPAHFDLTRQSLADFQRGFTEVHAGTEPGDVDWASFATWWGRGLQYVSFSRVD